MRIRRLQVRDLRRYRELDIDLAPGVTVVRGPNEAGKSTIQRAIELALTRRVTSNAADLESLRPWDAGPDARPWVAIEFEQDEEDGRLATGTLEKWFGGQKGTVDLVYDGQRVTDPALADQVLAELSGIANEAFFRSTASVRHHELSDLARDEAALRDRLQASISGADRGTGRVKKRLERAIYELTTKGDKNPGRLKLAEAAVAEAAATVEKGELDLAQLERDRDSLSTARERRLESERGLAEKRAMLEKARQAERLDAERTAARERYERFREAVEVATELDELAQTHPSPNPLPVIRQAVERLRVLDTRMRELRASLAGEIDVNFEVAPEPTWRPLSRLGLIAVLIGVLLAGGSIVLDVLGIADLGMPPLFLGAAVALIGGILSAVAVWLRRHSQMQEQLRDVEIDRRLRGRSEMEAELHQAEVDIEQQLGTLGLEDVPAAEDLLAREEAHVARMDQLVRPARRPGRQGAARDVAAAARRGGPRDRAEDERDGVARADRQGAAGARAARGRGPRSGGGARPVARRRSEHAGLGSRTSRSTPSRSRRKPSVWPCGASSWRCPSADTGCSRRRFARSKRPRRRR